MKHQNRISIGNLRTGSPAIGMTPKDKHNLLWQMPFTIKLKRCHEAKRSLRHLRFPRFVMTALAALALALFPRHAKANGFSSAAFIQPSDLVAFQGFGGAVAADGNLMAIDVQRAPFAVYVYVNNNGLWTQQARLASPTASPTNRFGSSLAMQGNTLVVGDGGERVAYVYSNVNGTSTEEAVLSPSGGSGVSFGGSSVNGLAISGNTIAVGAPSEPTPAGNTGSIYVFTGTNSIWTQQQRVVPVDPLVAGFGFSIALQNDTVVVGAPFTASSSVFEPGAAFVFTRQSGVWNQQARLDPVDVVAAGLYGICVSFDGNTAVVGAQRPCYFVFAIVNALGAPNQSELLFHMSVKQSALARFTGSVRTSPEQWPNSAKESPLHLPRHARSQNTELPPPTADDLKT